MQKTKRHAFINRIHVRLGLALALVGGFSLSANAGYAQLAPPSGFGGSAGNWTFAPSANQASYGNVLHHPGALRVPVPGTTATMPAAYRLAANAPRIAAAAIFMNPYVRAGVGIATWLGVAGIVWDAVNNRWAKPDNSFPVSDGMEYKLYETWHSSKATACEEMREHVSLPAGHSFVISSSDPVCATYAVSDTGQQYGWYNAQYTTRGSSCPVGWYVTPAGCVQNPPPKEVTKPEFEDLLAPKPMPETVPFEIPRPTPLPVEQPVINPEPGPNPTPRPLFVPTGNPVPNPNYDPNASPSPENQPWLQPAVRVVPSPTPTEPWRVDLQPVNRPVPGPEPMPEPLPEVDPNAPASDKPSQEQTDFCAKNPDVLACAKPELDTPEYEIPKSDKNITLMEENLFGPGACPADVYFAPHGLQQFKVWDWNQSCGYITEYLKPILIICCTFAAFMILIPGRTE